MTRRCSMCSDAKDAMSPEATYICLKCRALMKAEADAVKLQPRVKREPKPRDYGEWLAEGEALLAQATAEFRPWRPA